MTKTHGKARLKALSGLLLAVAAACSVAISGSGSTAPASAGAGTGKAAVVEFRSAGKRQAPVDLAYFIDGKPAVGQPLEIEITVTSRRNVSALDIAVSADAGVQLANAASRSAGRVQAGESVTLRVSATVLDDAPYYVNVSVATENPGVRELRHFSIPVDPGGTVRSSKQADRIIVTPAGERLLVLPSRRQ